MPMTARHLLGLATALCIVAFVLCTTLLVHGYFETGQLSSILAFAVIFSIAAACACVWLGAVIEETEVSIYGTNNSEGQGRW